MCSWLARRSPLMPSATTGPAKEPIADDGLMADGHTAALVPR
jgi:hypothetical protein